MTLSSWSTTALEDVATASPSGLRWFQLYVYKDRDVTLDLVRRAERAGYTALAVTVDTPVLGRREVTVVSITPCISLDFPFTTLILIIHPCDINSAPNYYYYCYCHYRRTSRIDFLCQRT